MCAREYEREIEIGMAQTYGASDPMLQFFPFLRAFSKFFSSENMQTLDPSCARCASAEGRNLSYLDPNLVVSSNRVTELDARTHSASYGPY